MVSEQLIKIRLFIAIGLSLLIYPLVLFGVVLNELKQWLSKKHYKDVTGEVAVITGAAHGLGREIAIELAKRGCHIAIVDINLKGAENTANFIKESFNVPAKAYKVDVSNYDEIVQLNENVTRDLGATTILVNNAGILVFQKLFAPEVREVQKMIDVNLTAHFWTIRVFLPKMTELQKGHIVAISSASSFFPMMHYTTYSSTKFGVRGLMQALRQELLADPHQRHIHTTTVYPTFMRTNDQVAELGNAIDITTLYPLVPGTEAAQRVVRGLLRNDAEVVIPSCLALIYRLLEVLPAALRDWLVVFSGVLNVKKIKQLATSNN